MRTTLQNPSLFQSKAFLIKSKKPSSPNIRKKTKINELNIPFLNELKLSKENYTEMETPKTFLSENKKKEIKNFVKSTPPRNFKIFIKMERGMIFLLSFKHMHFFLVFL